MKNKRICLTITLLSQTFLIIGGSVHKVLFFILHFYASAWWWFFLKKNEERNSSDNKYIVWKNMIKWLTVQLLQLDVQIFTFLLPCIVIDLF
jgi:hypothetical protein